MRIRNGRMILVFVLLVGGAGLLAWLATRPPAENAAERAPERAEDTGSPAIRPTGQPGAVRGEVRIFKGNEPAPGIPILVTGGRRAVRVTTRKDGTFRAEVETGRELTVTVKAPEPWAPVVIRGLLLSSGQTENLGALYLERAFLVKGLVVDREGKPVPGATVRALRPTLEGGRVNFLDIFLKFGNPRTPLEETSSTADGTFVLAKLSPGTYRLEAIGKGYAVGYISKAIVNPETESQVFRIVLAPGVSLPGTVKNPEGEPVAGAMVTAVRLRGRSRSAFEFEPVQTVTDERGEFTLEHLTSGQAQLIVAADGYPTRVEGNVVIGETKRVDVVLGGDAAIEGRITDSKGDPLEGAEVAVFLDQGFPAFGRTQSGADGRYRLERLPAGRIQIFMVRKDGYPPYPPFDAWNMFNRSREELEAGKTLTKNVTLKDGAVIRGRVTNGVDGSPVAGAEVVTMGGGVLGGLLGGNLSGTTDDAGDYRISGVGPGIHLLLVKATGFYQPGIDQRELLRSMAPFGNRSAEVGPDDPAVKVGEAGTEVAKDLKVLPGATVTGRVVAPDGTPVAGASVAPAAGDRRSALLIRFLDVGPGSVMTGEDGTFRFSGMAASDALVLEARASGYLASKSDPVSVGSGAEVTGVEIRLKAGGTVEGTVYGADGGPLAGAVVKVVPDARNQRDSWRVRSALWRAEATTTDGEGAFRVDGLEPGPVLIDVQASGHQPLQQRDVSVSEGGVTGGLALRMEKGYVIAGRVTDEEGNPLTGVRVAANAVRTQRAVPAIPPGRSGSSATTDAGGAYRMDRLATGAYRVTFRKDGYVPETRDGVTAGTENLDAALAKGLTITGIVYWPDGTPAANVLVTARQGRQSSSSAQTSAKGAFKLVNLKTGAYDLTARPSRFSPFGGSRDDLPDAAPATLPGVAAGTEGVEIRLSPALSISGVVTDEAGNPLAGTMIFASSEGEGGRPNGFARTDEHGAFRLRSLAEGTYVLRAMRRGYRLTGTGVKARAGASGVRVVMKKGPDVPRAPGKGPIRPPRRGR